MVGSVRVTVVAGLIAGMALGPSVRAQSAPPAQGQQATRPEPPLRASILRGEYGPHRANNDLLFYHLDIRVDPDRNSSAAGTPSASGCCATTRASSWIFTRI